MLRGNLNKESMNKETAVLIPFRDAECGVAVTLVQVCGSCCCEQHQPNEATRKEPE